LGLFVVESHYSGLIVAELFGLAIMLCFALVVEFRWLVAIGSKLSIVERYLLLVIVE